MSECNILSNFIVTNIWKLLLEFGILLKILLEMSLDIKVSWGLTPVGPTLKKKFILGIIGVAWFLDLSSHWLIPNVFAFYIHVVSL